MSGDGPDKQMIDTAGAVADFAYKQGVSDAIAVDHLIQRYRALREERDHALDDLEMLRAVNARLVKDIDQARIDAACIGEMADQAEAEAKRLREADVLLIEAMAYVRAFGSSGSAPVVVDREALDRASDDLLKRYDAYLETSDAVRERPIRHLPVNGPDDRQPNGPSTSAGRRAAEAGGRPSDDRR